MQAYGQDISLSQHAAILPLFKVLTHGLPGQWNSIGLP